MIKKGYDVTIAGIAKKVVDDYVLVAFKHGDPVWVSTKDIKTYAPCKWRTENGKE